MKNNYEKKIIQKRKEIDNILNNIKENIIITDKNIELIKNLIFAKITCMSHEIKITNRILNGTIKHYDREDMRNYLREYTNKKLKELCGK
jgi:hypothetical protein